MADGLDALCREGREREVSIGDYIIHNIMQT